MLRERRRTIAGTPARPLVIAHRGGPGGAPENTLAVFRRAVQARVDMIELDVRMSRDGVLVVIHDRRVVRTTGGAGRVCDLLLSQLQQLDAGSLSGRQFAGERIPTLAEVFRAVPASVGLNVEVKTDGDRRRSRVVADELSRLLRAEDPGRPVVVSSFDHAFLRVLHEISPGIPLGALYMAVRDFGKSPSRLCHRAGASTFICSRGQLRRRHVRDAHGHGIAVFVYGVDQSRHLGSVMRHGVDGVITNHPERLRRILEKAK